ncbi:Zinc finger CCCH domain-containing protein 18 [Apostasia shenzhenica]|uniref:Zinc finger CCCH domain-containing protein 18 n=1 Tax=Apostasia shenzhenica TaxID=1088818 RepID=A0A2I0AWK8_9ASPA|nr:Zinc finger CCCH domain-containing protein 18 [Apostasia shenzhenica]
MRSHGRGRVSIHKLEFIAFFLHRYVIMAETTSYEMDFPELTKILVSRIQKLEPNNVRKIVGYILFKEPNEQEMIQLGFGPEKELLSKIDDVKEDLGLSIAASSDPLHVYGSLPPGSQSISSPLEFHASGPYWEHQLAADFASRAYPDLMGEEFCNHHQTQLLNDEEAIDPSINVGNFYYPDSSMSNNILSKMSRRSPSLPEFPVKACHYFFKGFCKHGANCRYSHGQSFSEGCSQVFSPKMSELLNEEHGFYLGSLEKLELEIAELLRGRKGEPVSIASLPMLYYEKYGRNLQAEGYLTESQRHGKAGFNLTKLLARLKNSIRIIDRPHGQHSVILAEEASQYFEYRNGRSEVGSPTGSAHQIYLTFPAESSFTEDDVSNYFKQYGPVHDVRIPCQEKRMFGFVSFVYPETVSEILKTNSPHYICGARVLVKPYREKSRPVDRTIMDRMKPSMYFPPASFEVNPELHRTPRECETARLIKMHFDQKEKMELEMRRFSELKLTQKPLNNQSCCYNDEDLKIAQVPIEFPYDDHFSYAFDSLNQCSTTEERARNTGDSYNDQESQIELPENPFASPWPVGSGSSIINTETNRSKQESVEVKTHQADTSLNS